MILKCLVAVFFMFSMAVVGGEVWAFSQEFVRFGKKDAYEGFKKRWNSEYTHFFKDSVKDYPILAIQDLDDPEYTYLMPILSYARLGIFEDGLEKFQDTLKRDLTLGFSSTLNFEVKSLGIYLSECSYIPEFINASLCNMPYVHYQTFSLTPGNGEIFEQRLKKMAFEEAMKKSNVCWRVFKTVFGGDVPKYVVYCFAQSQDALESDRLHFIDEELKSIVRRYREGKGILRRDLSILVPTNT
ncbi:MAG: hypothetical protein V4494_02700 [Chlamydiota bacterium]